MVNGLFAVVVSNFGFFTDLLVPIKSMFREDFNELPFFGPRLEVVCSGEDLW